MDLDALQLESEDRFYAMREKMRAHVAEVLDDYMARRKPETDSEVRSYFGTVAAGERTLRQLSGLPPLRRPRAPKSPAEPKPEPRPKDSQAGMLSELRLISKLLDKTGGLDNDNQDESTPASPPHAYGEVDASEAKQTEGTAPQPAPPKHQPEPEPVPPPSPPREPTPQQQLDARLDAAARSIDQITYRYAEWTGVWPDGELFRLEDADWRIHTGAQPLDIDLDGDEAAHTRLLTTETLRRCNTIVRHIARDMGCWLDARPYSESDPDFWSLSANFERGIGRPADNEKPSPRCLPWWIVHKPPT